MSARDEDRLISERTIPSLKGQPAIPETPITEEEWRRERDRYQIEQGLRELGFEVDRLTWHDTDLGES